MALFVPLALVSVSPALADVVYLYDELGRLVRVIDETGHAATYHYDKVGNLLRITRESNVSPETTVSSVSASSFALGTSTAVVITGVNLIGADVTASPGVTVIVVERGGETLTVKVIVAGNAALGEASLTIRTDLGTVTVPITIVPNPSTITTVAGNGQPIRAFLRSPFGVVVESQGSLLVADAANNLVHKVGADGTSSLVAGSTRSPSCRGAARGFRNSQERSLEVCCQQNCIRPE